MDGPNRPSQILLIKPCTLCKMILSKIFSLLKASKRKTSPEEKAKLAKKRKLERFVRQIRQGVQEGAVKEIR